MQGIIFTLTSVLSNLELMVSLGSWEASHVFEVRVTARNLMFKTPTLEGK